MDLFFVLSGYLIAGQLFNTVAKRKQISLKTFMIKRVFRIIPPYLVVLALYAIFPALREREHMAPLWKYLTFTLNLSLDLRTYGTFTHAWSLCIEEQFYLVLPLLVLLLNYLKWGKRSGYLLVALFLFGFAIRLFVWRQVLMPQLESDDFVVIWYRYIYYPVYTRLDGLLVGVSIAGLFTFYPKYKGLANRYANQLLILGLLLLTAAYFICREQASFGTTIYGFPLIAIAYGLIVAAVVCPACVVYSVKSWLTTQLATLSYSIYLVHKMVIHVTQAAFGDILTKDSNLMLLLCIVTSVLGALVLRYMVEKPALRLRNRTLIF